MILVCLAFLILLAVDGKPKVENNIHEEGKYIDLMDRVQSRHMRCEDCSYCRGNVPKQQTWEEFFIFWLSLGYLTPEKPKCKDYPLCGSGIYEVRSNRLSYRTYPSYPGGPKFTWMKKFIVFIIGGDTNPWGPGFVPKQVLLYLCVTWMVVVRWFLETIKQAFGK